LVALGLKIQSPRGVLSLGEVADLVALGLEDSICVSRGDQLQVDLDLTRVGWIGLHYWIHTGEYEDRTENDEDEPKGKADTDEQFLPDLSLINLRSL